MSNARSESEQIIIRNGSGTKFHSIPLDSLIYNNTRTRTAWAQHIPKPTARGVSQPPELPASSCNGLILIPHFEEKRTWVLWNPFTGEYYKLPHYIPSEGDRMPSCGLGYDSGAAHDYKVVRIAQLYDGGRTSETLVYSLNSDSWKRIVDFPGTVYGGFRGLVAGYFLDGALHWMSCDKEEIRIVALDVGTETYRVMPLPSAVVNRRLASEVNLDVLGGSLFVSCCYSHSRVEGWMMKEYGVNDSWTKLFSFKKRYPRADTGLFRPIAYLKSKGLVLFQHDGKEFFWYDVDKKTAKEVTFRGADFSYFSSQVLTPSCFQLNDDSDDSDGGVAGRRSAKQKMKDRLKLLLTFEDVSIKNSDE